MSASEGKPINKTPRPEKDSFSSDEGSSDEEETINQTFKSKTQSSSSNVETPTKSTEREPETSSGKRKTVTARKDFEVKRRRGKDSNLKTKLKTCLQKVTKQLQENPDFDLDTIHPKIENFLKLSTKESMEALLALDTLKPSIQDSSKFSAIMNDLTPGQRQFSKESVDAIRAEIIASEARYSQIAENLANMEKFLYYLKYILALNIDGSSAFGIVRNSILESMKGENEFDDSTDAIWFTLNDDDNDEYFELTNILIKF